MAGQLMAPQAPTSQGTLTLTLLGSFELACDGQAVELPMSAQRLLALLALSDRPMLRPRVAGTLWMDASEERAAANLRSSLWRINRTGHALVAATDQRLVLAPWVEVDARRTAALAQQLLSGAPCAEGVHRGCCVLRGELLPDWYDDWVLLERERLRQLTLHALERLAEQLLAARRFDDALQAALAAVAGEPLRDTAQRLLIEVHLAEGNRCEALRALEVYRALLNEQLGLAPSPQLEALVRGT